MLKNAMLTVLMAAAAQVSLAQSGSLNSAHGASSYHDFVRQILLSQVNNSANKSTVLKERLIGSKIVVINSAGSGVTDSFRYQYNAERGSQLPNNNFAYRTYSDYSWNNRLRLGDEDPTTSTLNYDSANWVSSSQAHNYHSIKTYDNAGYLNEYIVQDIQQTTGLVASQHKCHYTYDASHHCTGITFSVNNTTQTGSTWTIALVYTFIYQGSLLVFDSTYDVTNGIPTRKTTYKYNSAGKPIQTEEQTWGLTDWNNVARHSASYDGLSRLQSSTEETWQNGAYSYTVQDSFGYQGNVGIFIYDATSNWNSGVFTKMQLHTAALNTFNAIDSEIIGPYSGGKAASTKYFYNQSGHLDSMSGYSYIGNSRQLGTTYYYTYEPYNDPTLVIQTPGNDGDPVVYPNPVRSDLHLKFTSAPKGEIELKINDLVGRNILSRRFTPATGLHMDVSYLPAGTYSVQLRYDATIRCIKIQKQ